MPEGHYTDASMAATVVPNRNAIMLSVAVGVAVARGAEAVATAVHAGDHAVYPDCRPAFIEAIEHEARVANEGFIADGFQVLAPFLHLVQGRDRPPRRRARRAVRGDVVLLPGRGAPLRPLRHLRRAAGGVRARRRPRPHPLRGGAGVSFTIAKRFSFSASHALTAVPEDHKCRRTHGHNYEVEVSAPPTSSTIGGWSSTTSTSTR